jgi:hypothetical protein
MPRIEIVVDKKGGTETTVHGITGGGCKVASEGYEALFGAVESEVQTHEAFEEPEQVEMKAKQSN